MRLCLLLGALVAAVLAAPCDAAPAKPSQMLWFDPTQLPSFSGTVERFLPNPAGQVDRLIFKEGPQIAFPPSAYEGVHDVATSGKPLIVWGIRSRNAPIIVMLAYAANQETEPTIIDRFYWRADLGDENALHDLKVEGEIKAPYLSPRGDLAGAILADGSVVEIAPAIAAKLKDLLAPGEKLTAEGKGMDGAAGRAILAERVGASADALKPLPPADDAQASKQ